MGVGTLSLFNGQDVRIWTITGTVLDASASRSLVVASTGGGGYVSPPRINAATIVRKNIWIRDAAGQEHEVATDNAEIPVRPGHNVSFYYSAPEGSRQGILQGMFNHDVGQYWNLSDYAVPPLHLSRGYSPSWFVMILAVVSMICMLFGGEDMYGKRVVADYRQKFETILSAGKYAE